MKKLKNVEAEIAEYGNSIQNATVNLFEEKNTVDMNRYGIILSIYKICLLPQVHPRQNYRFCAVRIGIMWYEEDIFHYDLPFAINILVLSGRLPKRPPLYPLHLETETRPRLEKRRGIKESASFYPFKRVFKMARGDTGDRTFLATNGKKLLYLRGQKTHSGNAILASKLATLVSKKHFSSERLLDNYLAGSRKLNSYVMPASKNGAYEQAQEWLEKEDKIIPGTGIINEVLNFVNETDPNWENFAFSSTQVSDSYLVKIDFDFCNLYLKLSLEDYEQDILFCRRGLFRTQMKLKQDPLYVREILHTRLTLALLSEELISGLADKAYLDNEQWYKQIIIKEMLKRTGMALNLFLEHPQAKVFLENHPKIFLELNEHFTTYTKRHFNELAQEAIIASILKKASEIQRQIFDRFNLNLLCTKSPPASCQAQDNLDQEEKNVVQPVPEKAKVLELNTITEIEEPALTEWAKSAIAQVRIVRETYRGKNEYDQSALDSFLEEAVQTLKRNNREPCPDEACKKRIMAGFEKSAAQYFEHRHKRTRIVLDFFFCCLGIGLILRCYSGHFFFTGAKTNREKTFERPILEAFHAKHP